MSKIPTLQAGVRGIIDSKNLTDTCLYVLRHGVMNPGSTSELVEDYLVSFKKIEATHENDPQAAVSVFKVKLEAALKRATGVDITVAVKLDVQEEDEAKQTVSISLVNTNTGDPIIPLGKIESNKQNNSLSINFN